MHWLSVSKQKNMNFLKKSGKPFFPSIFMGEISEPGVLEMIILWETEHYHSS